MIDENITKIIPKVIGERHNMILSSAFESNRQLITETLVFAVDSEGYINPFTVRIRLMNNIDKGIQLIGFLSPINLDEDLIMYDKNSGILYGVSRNDNGISNILVYGDKKNQSEFLI